MRVFLGVDDGPGDGGTAMEVVEGVGADWGGEERAGHACGGGDVEFCAWKVWAQDIAI